LIEELNGGRLSIETPGVAALVETTPLLGDAGAAAIGWLTDGRIFCVAAPFRKQTASPAVRGRPLFIRAVFFIPTSDGNFR